MFCVLHLTLHKSMPLYIVMITVYFHGCAIFQMDKWVFMPLYFITVANQRDGLNRDNEQIYQNFRGISNLTIDFKNGIC